MFPRSASTRIVHGLSNALLALTLTAGCATTPGAITLDSSGTPEPSTLSLELGEWEEALSVLTVQREEYPRSARIAYSLGLACWGKLGSMRAAGNSLRPMGMLDREEELFLTRALEQFLSVLELEPSEELAAKALYMAGLCLDIGNLQRFEEALEAYGTCSDRYPGSEAAWRCLERRDELRKKFDGIRGGSHGLGQ